MRHTPNDRVSIREPRQSRHVFTQLNARQRCGDRREGTADIERSIRFRIPSFQLALPAARIHQNHGLGAAEPTWQTGACIVGTCLWCGSCQTGRCQADSKELSSIKKSKHLTYKLELGGMSVDSSIATTVRLMQM